MDAANNRLVCGDGHKLGPCVAKEQSQFSFLMLSRLVWVSEEQPEFLPDKNVNILLHHSTRRLLWHGATSRAEILGLSDAVTNLNNGWRSAEKAQGKRTNHSTMRRCCSGIRSMLEPLLKFSRAMWSDGIICWQSDPGHGEGRCCWGLGFQRARICIPTSLVSPSTSFCQREAMMKNVWMESWHQIRPCPDLKIGVEPTREHDGTLPQFMVTWGTLEVLFQHGKSCSEWLDDDLKDCLVSFLTLTLADLAAGTLTHGCNSAFLVLQIKFTNPERGSGTPHPPVDPTTHILPSLCTTTHILPSLCTTWWKMGSWQIRPCPDLQDGEEPTRKQAGMLPQFMVTWGSLNVLFQHGNSCSEWWLDDALHWCCEGLPCELPAVSELKEIRKEVKGVVKLGHEAAANRGTAQRPNPALEELVPLLFHHFASSPQPNEPVIMAEKLFWWEFRKSSQMKLLRRNQFEKQPKRKVSLAIESEACEDESKGLKQDFERIFIRFGQRLSKSFGAFHRNPGPGLSNPF
jgi:hypothetical protein